MKAVIYGLERTSGGAGNRIARAMAEGCKRRKVEYDAYGNFDGVIRGDIALCYGWVHELKTKLFSSYLNAGAHCVFFDLGYWGRGNTGYYRIGIDSWDTRDNLKRNCSSDRFDSFAKRGFFTLRNGWNFDSKKIMIVGMSDKAARTHGYEPQQWENQTLAWLKENVPEYEPYIRQKPTMVKEKMPSIDEAFRDTYFVVSHHSNVSVECLVANIPYHAVKGVGTLLCPRDLTAENIREPEFPANSDRMQLLYDTAYSQWSIGEMQSGECWDYISGVVV